ncbi:MAG: hypothetical protein LBK44_06920 [Spirochaetales bacterium]|nr:hypothetical protein [Spirochaetales bacterium]
MQILWAFRYNPSRIGNSKIAFAILSDSPSLGVGSAYAGTKSKRPRLRLCNHTARLIACGNFAARTLVPLFRTAKMAYP